jgi:hypothetical protein
MPRGIPWRELCANDCGRRRAPGEQLCSSCKRQREQMLSSPYPMEQGQRSGGRGSSETAADEHSPSAARGRGIKTHPRLSEQSFQAEALRDMNRCEFCNAPFGSHASDCEGYASFVDFAEEYADEPTEEAL